jgi:putative transposase
MTLSSLIKGKNTEDNTKKYWPHAPVHKLGQNGTYMITCGTYRKEHFLAVPERKTKFMNLFFELAAQYGWQLQAWAIMSNHYHFIAHSPENPENLKDFMLHLHSLSATVFNREDNTPSRKFWYQFWDKLITFEKSYLARLNYVNKNPVHHGVAADAENYFWCSAAWFKTNSDKAFARTVENFKIDKLNVYDNF